MDVAIAEGTYVITAAFTDEDGAAVTPNAVTWTLLDGSYSVVNSRSAVSVTPATSITIVLSGDDLKLSDGEWRIVRVNATYDSSNGTDLPLIGSCEFLVDPAC